MCAAVTESFFEYYGTRCQTELLDESTLRAIPSLNEYYQQMADWDWRFGRTPDFSHHLETRFEWGGIDIHLDVHRGVIQESKVYSDAMDPEMITLLEGALPGAKYTAPDVEDRIDTVESHIPERTSELGDIRRWIATQVG